MPTRSRKSAAAPATGALASIDERRMDGRRVQYLVSWENGDSTWENRATLVADGRGKDVTRFERERKEAEAAAPPAKKAKSPAAARSKSPAPRKAAARVSRSKSPARKPKPAAPARKTPPSQDVTQIDQPEPDAPRARSRRASNSPAPKKGASPKAPSAKKKAATSPAPPAKTAAAKCPATTSNALLGALMLGAVALVGSAAGHCGAVGPALAGVGVDAGFAMPLAVACCLLAVLLHADYGSHYGKWISLGLVWRLCAEYVLAAVYVGSEGAAQYEAFVAVVVGCLVSHVAFAMANAPALHDTRLALLACAGMVASDYVLAYEGGASAALTSEHQLVRTYGAGLSVVAYALAAISGSA